MQPRNGYIARDRSRYLDGCDTCRCRSACLTSALSATELREFRSITRLHSPLHEGRVLCRAGDAFHSLYVVRSGSLKSYTIGDDGSFQVTGFHFPGELLGFASIHTRTHPVTIESLEMSLFTSLRFPPA